MEQTLATPPDGGKRPAMAPELEARLRAELEPEIARLEELTGWDLDAWRTGPAIPVATADVIDDDA